MITETNEPGEEKKQIEDLANCCALESTEIIAGTTTGIAKNYNLLKHIYSPILIVEEAAEVYEAHILTSLTKTTQHLVLIGDHQQLRPNPAIYDLIQYNLDLSLFERLLNNNIEYKTLTFQRRMRPEISKIIKLIYPHLDDHKCVVKYPHVRSVEKDLFFFNHKFQESTNDAIQSKYNSEEAKIIVRFAKYLLQQNYDHTQITILTLYAAQIFEIKRIIRGLGYVNDSLNQIKVINVDNFQGEENDTIILSLVRSNKDNQIGYLKVSNRVCVALSRAKFGFYLFGNADCLFNAKNASPEQKKLWFNVLNTLLKMSSLEKNLC